MTGIPARAISRTSNGQIITGAGVLKGAGLCAGVDAATATFYDGTDNTGAVLGKLGAGIGLSAPETLPADGVAFMVGVYVEVTGTAPRVTAYV